MKSHDVNIIGVSAMSKVETEEFKEGVEEFLEKLQRDGEHVDKAHYKVSIACYLDANLSSVVYSIHFDYPWADSLAREELRLGSNLPAELEAEYEPLLEEISSYVACRLRDLGYKAVEGTKAEIRDQSNDKLGVMTEYYINDGYILL